jgi:hypothetical protein
LIAPFFKGFMFLLAAFGIVDIAFNTSKNEHIRKKEMDYLSVVDGLQYIRLTPLGAFIMGFDKRLCLQGQEGERQPGAGRQAAADHAGRKGSAQSNGAGAACG